VPTSRLAARLMLRERAISARKACWATDPSIQTPPPQGYQDGRGEPCEPSVCAYVPRTDVYEAYTRVTQRVLYAVRVNRLSDWWI
jgi:hypothetical protein